MIFINLFPCKLDCSYYLALLKFPGHVHTYICPVPFQCVLNWFGDCSLPSGLRVHQQSKPWQIQCDLCSTVYLCIRYICTLLFCLLPSFLLSPPSSSSPLFLHSSSNLSPPLTLSFPPPTPSLPTVCFCWYFPLVYWELPKHPTRRQVTINPSHLAPSAFA